MILSIETRDYTDAGCVRVVSRRISFREILPAGAEERMLKHSLLGMPGGGYGWETMNAFFNDSQMKSWAAAYSPRQ